MNAELILYATPLFRIGENLFRNFALSEVQRQPEEVDREEILLHYLGNRAWDRICHFRDYYSTHWGESGKGRPMSHRAYEALCRFAKYARFPIGQEPSIFLTDAGHLELVWEDAAGQTVQIEFTPQRAEYYIESQEVESVAEYKDLQDLAMQLSKL